MMKMIKDDNTIVFYCLWNVTINENGRFISPLHYSYIKEASAKFENVVLVSNSINTDCTGGVELGDIEFYNIGCFNGYLASMKKTGVITRTLREVFEKHPDSFYYIRCPQPFFWMFHIHNFKNNGNMRLLYHFMSNPIEAILNKKSDNKFLRFTKAFLYLPSLFICSFFGRKAKMSCNGALLKENLSYILPKSTIVLNESTVRKSEFIDQAFVSERDVNKPIRLLYVGYLRHAKGVVYLIEALKMLHDKNVPFTCTLVGDGDARDELENKVNDFGLGGSVSFLGEIKNRNRILEIYQDHDIFVFPSLSEGSPRVVIEAMSQGLPVVATDVGNTKNLVSDFGFTVSPGNTKELFEKILFYYENERIRYAMSMSSIIHIKDYTIESFFDSLRVISKSYE